MYTEHQIQTQIINLLQVKGYYVQRMNSGNYSVGEGRYKRFVMGAAKGTPDIMAFKSLYDEDAGFNIIQLAFIEVKRPGNKPTFYQEQKMKELTEYGAKCFVATSMEDICKALNIKL